MMGTSRTLITGATGFLGRHLTNQIRSLGDTVTGLSRHASSPQILACDLARSLRVAELVSQTLPDVIFHLAALTPASAPTATFDDYLRVNVQGTLNLFEAVHKFVPAARIISVTSSAMYGQPEATDGIIFENSTLRPVNAYGVSKATQHLVGYQYHAQHKLDIVRVCPFNLTGYSLPKGLVASDFGRQIAAVERGLQEPVIRVGDLTCERDFLDVQDAVSALIALSKTGTTGEAYNLASERAVTISTVLSELLAMSKVAIQIQPFASILPNSVPIQIGSRAKLAAATGWSPQIPLVQSLADVLDYWRTVKEL